MRDEIKLFYDINAEKISNEWYENSAMMPNIKEFIEILPNRPKVLDLGCGTGYESIRLSSLGALWFMSNIKTLRVCGVLLKVLQLACRPGAIYVLSMRFRSSLIICNQYY